MRLTPEQIAELRLVQHGYMPSVSLLLAAGRAVPELLDAAAQLAQLRAILERVRPLEAEATPTPWEVQGSGGIKMDGTRGSYSIVSGPYQVCRHAMGAKDVEQRADFALIAATRNAIADMLRAVQP
jgi:hypothetical protein